MTGVLRSIVPESGTDKALLVFGVALFFAVTYALFIHVPKSSMLQNSPALGYIETTGTVRRRHVGSLTWSNLQKGDIYLRDVVYTPKDTTAEFVWGNQRLKLEPDSMVQFDEVTLERIEIVLLEGKARMKSGEKVALTSRDIAPRREEAVRILPYPKSSRIASILSDLGHQEAQLEKLTQTLNDSMGKYIVFEPVVKVTLPTLELNRVTDYEIKLLTPAAGVYNIGEDSWIKMSWSQVPLKNAVYQIEVAKDPKFRSAIRHSTANADLSIQLEEPGTYYWRVRAIRGKEFVLSEASTFSMQKQAGVDPISQRLPTQIPADIPKFSWEVAKDRGFENSIRNSQSRNPVCPNVGFPPGIYFCRIRESATNKVVKEYRFNVR